jgi:putative membrane protein
LNGAEEQADRPRRGPLGWLGLWLRGVAMGIAELVPGVSGGTIAFITGIYRELVAAIHAVDHVFLRELAGLRPMAAWRRANGGFLLVLVLGMGSSLLAFSSTVQWLLAEHEILVWAFFFGLIIASVVFIAGHVTPWTGPRIGLAFAGLACGALVSMSDGLPVSDSLPVAFAAGAVAICAWILPGVSGSFMLLLLGQYQRIIKALAGLDLVVVATFAAGCAVGLVIFARVLHWLLARAYAGTLAFLCGFMAGALQKLWPWRQTLSYYLDSDGDGIPVAVRPISPLQFRELYGEDPQILAALLAASAGLALVVLLDLASRRRVE